ncbi:hypothetical protein KDW_13320 [Dictyobacter vulcani]|uniref:Uncharacterized protein n=1 Tax=Dictyobacter vulcani TaxID=2607529 RepID=A0A5J4KL70_9CHLR|nr:hypothetical protein KDW_13320 [Dictyobacter vulcani]
MATLSAITVWVPPYYPTTSFVQVLFSVRLLSCLPIKHNEYEESGLMHIVYDNVHFKKERATYA